MTATRPPTSRRPLAWATTALAGLCSCTVGPNYSPPTPATPAAWSAPLEGGASAGTPTELALWWNILRDPLLTSLIERSIAGSPDLREARARVVEARAQRAVVAGRDGPDVNATAGYSRSRASENAFVIPGGGVGALPGGNSGTDLYQVGFDASWELDLFGGTRRAVQAATADLDAAAESERSVLITLAAEVARAYIEVRSFQNRLAIADNNVRVQRDAVDLARARYSAGLTSELDTAQAEAQLSATRAQVPTLEAGLSESAHRLEVLLGRNPGSLTDELITPGPIPAAPADLPVGLPSDLLRRRPDIRQAERQIAGASARIGVATADLFPRVALTGQVGLQSTQFGSLPQGDSRYWVIGPSLTWSVFSMGRIKNNIRVQEAREQQALARYDRTVLGAFEETENALVSYGRELLRRQSLTEAVAADRRAVDMATALYTRGLSDFLAVLDAQGRLFRDEEQLAISERTVAINLVSLYKALGGGWDQATAPPGPR